MRLVFAAALAASLVGCHWLLPFGPGADDEGVERLRPDATPDRSPACNAQSCPAGCCKSGACITPPDDEDCGQHGAGCTSCASLKQTCDPDGNCVPPAPCTAGCAGCCEQGTCVLIATDTRCGVNGSKCADCTASGEKCESGACAPATTCGVTTCPGCCDASGKCQVGGADTACGGSGGPCSVCPAGYTCQASKCQAASCDATTCPNGCCAAGACQPGDQDDACGVTGNPCVDCAVIFGYACERSLWICRVLCDSGNCWAGCCEAGMCHSPPTNTYCGLFGSSCQTCQGTQSCVSGNCQP